MHCRWQKLLACAVAPARLFERGPHYFGLQREAVRRAHRPALLFIIFSLYFLPFRTISGASHPASHY